MTALFKWWGVRFALYGVGFGASLLAMAGYADYDPATGTLDIHPFNLTELVQDAITLTATGIASIAVLKGWGKK